MTVAAPSDTAATSAARHDKPAARPPTLPDRAARFGLVLAGFDRPDTSVSDEPAADAEPDSKHNRIPDDAEDPATLLALSGAVAAGVGIAASAATAKPPAAAGTPGATSASASRSASTQTVPASEIPKAVQDVAPQTSTAIATVTNTCAAAVQQPAPPAAIAKPARSSARGAAIASTAEILAARTAQKPVGDTAGVDAEAVICKSELPSAVDIAQPAIMAPVLTASALDGALAASAQPLATGAAERQLDLAKGAAWLDGLARDIAATADGSGTLRFQLSPQALGTLDIELTRGDDGAALRMTTATVAAQTILSAAKPQLLAEARAHGLNISAATVDLGSVQHPDASGSLSSAHPGADGQSHRQPQPHQQSEPDFYLAAHKVASAPAKPDGARRDDAGYA